MGAEDNAYREVATRIVRATESGGMVLSLQGCRLSSGVLEILFRHIHRLLPSLRDLDLSFCNLYELPAELSSLAGLQKLCLNGNQFKTIPEVISSLTDLTELHLTTNNISRLAANIELPNALQVFCIGNNGLDTLPTTIGSLSQLRHLDVSLNQISILPSEICLLSELQYLFLLRNQITELPEQIGLLQRLQELYLSSNNIRDLPDSFESLETLKRLDLSGNCIAMLPPIIGRLKNLQYLNLNNNPVGDEGINAIAKYASKLKTLQVRNCRIGRVHVILDLLSRVRFRSADERLAYTLDDIDIGENALTTASGTAVDMVAFSEKRLYPVDEVVSYLRAAIRSDAQLLLEARLVLVGVGGVGKSQLAGALARKLEKGQRAEEYTKGIEVEELNLDVPGFDEPVRVRVFDCGGQPEQFSMHVLVWESLRNGMALVCDATNPFGWDKGNRGDYFLRMIESVLKARQDGGDETTPPPVLGVVTMADKVNKKMPALTTPDMIKQAGGKRKLNLELVEKPIDTLHHIGLEDVRDAMAKVIAQVPGLAAVVPASFAPVRKAVEEQFGTHDDPKLDRRSMLLSVYHDITEEAEKLPGQREIYLRIMHALGDLIHIPESEENGGKLKDKVINIHWARKAMYKLLTSPLVKQCKGVLTWEHWQQIPEDDRSQLLVDLMKAQRVLYEIQKTEISTLSQKIHWLLPDMLPYSEAPHDWATKTPAQSVEFESFLPESVFLRFVGENRELIRPTFKHAYRDEVVLTNKDGIRALVRPDYESEKHAIHFYADTDPTMRDESERWCGALFTKLTGDPPELREPEAKRKDSGGGVPRDELMRGSGERLAEEVQSQFDSRDPAMTESEIEAEWDDILKLKKTVAAKARLADACLLILEALSGGPKSTHELSNAARPARVKESDVITLLKSHRFIQSPQSNDYQIYPSGARLLELLKVWQKDPESRKFPRSK